MIVVVILDRVPASVRGDLSRWMVEPRAGVFVGRVTAQVRDRLWDRVLSRVRDGASLKQLGEGGTILSLLRGSRVSGAAGLLVVSRYG